MKRSSSPSAPATSCKRTQRKSAPRRVGNFILGPQINSNTVSSISQYLGHDPHTNELSVIKILSNVNDKFDQNSLQNKMLLHNEFSLLTTLKQDEGVMHLKSLHKDDEKICLLIDCYVRHELNPLHDYTSLQNFIYKEKHLEERDALLLFYKIVKIVECIHEKNIVHRDLKLGNIIYDLKSLKIFLINFSLGRNLINENEMLNEQLGSPAYISPDILSQNPYLGKPSDIWSLGVILYAMLFGQFPFYDQVPERLFKKVCSGDFIIPSNNKVSNNVKCMIQNILQLNPKKRLNASQILDISSSILTDIVWRSISFESKTQQKVPECSGNCNELCAKNSKKIDDKEFQNELESKLNITNIFNHSDNSRYQPANEVLKVPVAVRPVSLTLIRSLSINGAGGSPSESGGNFTRANAVPFPIQRLLSEPGRNATTPVHALESLIT